MANRDRHRQGLVYGPVRPSGPRDRGRIVGNLLGLLVVVVTVSLLSIAIYFVIQARDNAPPPTVTAPPSSFAVGATSASPSGSAQANASPTVGATSDPTPTPTPTLDPTAVPNTPSPEVTPAPTLTPPPVQVGAGFITFGTRDDGNFRVADPKTTFGIEEPMVWSAYLTQPANSNDLTIKIWKIDSPLQSEPQLIREDEVTPNAHDVQIFFRRLHPIGVSAGPGLFTIQYVRSDQVLAQGSFLVQ